MFPLPPLALLLQAAPTERLLSLSTIDLVIIALYFVMVIGIGFYLKRFTKTGEDFFLAGRSMTAWVAGLSFVAANLGALELMGWAGSAYQYGILAAHWYWIGAIPAMIFLGLVMMPFYYISKTHSVPGYLRLRYGNASHALASILFACMTLLVSGIDMFAMAVVLNIILGWNMGVSIWVSSLTVGAYVFLGGLLSAIFNEVLQFFLIWLGAIVISVLGLIEVGGWSGLVARIHANFPNQDYTHMWRVLGHFSDNPMGINWFGIVIGLGFVVSFGYWTTDFLVVQRVLAARDLRSAKMAPIIGSIFKMALPFIVILPGLLGLAVLPEHLVGQDQVTSPAQHTYNQVLPLMLARYCGPGLLGLGITALVAGFMSGMAGNISAFATVWTYDIYRGYLKRDAGDQHYLRVGRVCIILGVLISVGTAYLVMQFASIMDYVQALFTFFIAPLFGVVVFGMLWKRTTAPAGFWALLAGTCSSIGMWLWVKTDPSALQYVALSPNAKPMAENMFRALWCWIITAIVTIVVSLATKPKAESELVGLVYGATPLPSEGELPLYRRPAFWAVLVGVVFVILNVIFW